MGTPTSILSHPLFNKMTTAIRVLAMDAVEKAQSGHPGMPMGMAEVATVLFGDFLKFDPSTPLWPDRDRFVLSAGHGSMLLYALNYLTGYSGMTLDQLKTFRQWGSHTPGHPEVDLARGIETTTGPLSQGLGNAVGMALAERLLHKRYGSDLVDHYTYVLVGDGCLMEGLSHEALSLAGHLKLAKLIVLFDDNKITIDGPTSLSVSDDQQKRLQAYGWHVQHINGHQPNEIHKALKNAHEEPDRPSFIACRTIIGFGAPTKAGTSGVHGSPLGTQESSETRKALNWSYPPFEIPDDILMAWRQVGQKHKATQEEWQKRLDRSSHKKTFLLEQKGDLPTEWMSSFLDLKKEFLSTRPSEATRQSSGKVVECVARSIPAVFGGSADLTGSNNTKPVHTSSVQAPQYAGQYIHYGVREHGMMAALNGLALHGGIIPYGGTFLVFSDYCRPALRLSALMHQRVILILTHDSIGLGEDGPTHQPIEHLASLRAIPNLYVFRPADGIEVIEAWILALQEKNAPSVIALTRQPVPTVRVLSDRPLEENLSAQGGYVLSEAENPQVTLLASGSEVSLALKVQQLLKEEGLASRVVSLPCWALFDQQPLKHREKVLGIGTLRVAIEAGVSQGWDRYVGSSGLIFSLNRFGASAPYEDLYHRLGFNPQDIVKKIKHHWDQWKDVGDQTRWEGEEKGLKAGS